MSLVLQLRLIMVSKYFKVLFVDIFIKLSELLKFRNADDENLAMSLTRVSFEVYFCVTTLMFWFLCFYQKWNKAYNLIIEWNI